ncbi:MAG TPA: hypothetical protein VLV17_06290 [Anaeromyxobacteraceae bacterium]|nr:hypothetical protein [Anaeromyxobacteraceae bacterium]
MKESSIETAVEPEGKASPRRQLKNFLVDPRLQLRLGGYLVAVVVVLSGALGWQIWRARRTASALVALGDPRADAVVGALLANEDRTSLYWMCAGLVALALLLLVLSLIVTHRIAGPALALARACRAVRKGALSRPRSLRKGDLLHGLSREIGAMFLALREREEGERDRLREAVQLLESDPETARQLVADLLAEKERRLRT